MAGKKVYFAGSIRGGREDAALYRRIIEYIQKTDTVLTEHVGDLSLSKQEGSTPKGFSDGEKDVAIYLQDTGWLQESDIVVAECTTPSLGVGYELAYAEKLGKQVHIFYDSTRTTLSAMLTGDKYFDIHPYKTEEEIYPVIDSILQR
ncbi:MAG: nucleoside 2-deoxyribosyltransferase [Bacteroidales bacterium]|nr:nucleoside 2-deoxyribosyltransferase [Bacteroidales bacterium]